MFLSYISESNHFTLSPQKPSIFIRKAVTGDGEGGHDVLKAIQDQIVPGFQESI